MKSCMKTQKSMKPDGLFRKAITFNFDGLSDDNKKVVGKVHGDLITLVERVDVMAEIPQFIKNIATGVSGTKPYIYQFCNDMEIEIDDGVKESGMGLRGYVYF